MARRCGVPELSACLGLLLPAVAGAQPAAREISVAILPLEVRAGVTAEVTELLADGLLAAVKETGVFARVVGTRELLATLGVEQQKQLLECGASDCLAEVGGALNVTYLLLGSAGRLGDSGLLSLKLVQARGASIVAAVQERVPGGTDESLLDAVRPALRKILTAAALLAPVPAAAPPPAVAVTDGPGWRPWALLGAGAAGVVTAVAPMLAGLASLSAAAFVLQGLFGLVVPVTGLSIWLKLGVLGGSGAGGALLLAGTLLLVVAGLGLGVTGLVLRLRG